MTRKIGISTGAFYLLYSSKEDLFCETLERVQDRLKVGCRTSLVMIGARQDLSNL
ncbi:TetR/AcrR family transcriptional regulator [Clostridium botulinum]|nr:TetR/AcrR family transcriptional regulator [Clostridium botulinum]